MQLSTISTVVIISTGPEHSLQVLGQHCCCSQHDDGCSTQELHDDDCSHLHGFSHDVVHGRSHTAQGGSSITSQLQLEQSEHPD